MSQVDLQSKFPFMTPIKSPPPLLRFNGCGVGMYGRRDFDAETGAYISTLCLSLLFIPVLALRAYRVVRAEDGGWYFLGREALSTLAKTCNMLLVFAIAAVVGMEAYSSHTSTPAYKASRQMSVARGLAAQGRLAQAADVYRELASAGADQARNAASALGELLDNPCKQAPLSEGAAVFASAAAIVHCEGAATAEQVWRKGLDLAGQKGQSDPLRALTLLDAVRPLAGDPRQIDERRLPLLWTRAAAEPGNIDILCRLASLLEQQDKLDEAAKLLLPLKAKLGEGEGSRVLGTILARQGDYEGAYNLLWPYVKGRLERLHGVEKSYRSTMEALWNREIALLNQNKAPAEFYSRYNSSSSQQQQAMVDDYVSARLKSDPSFTSMQASLRRESAVVPVALDLGMVMLQRVGGQGDAASRKAQLEAAEKLFLSIGGVAGESDQYRLSLGQVQYWLGKQEQGRKLFDEFLQSKGRDSSSLLAVAARLRDLGAHPESRSTAEEAYARAATDEQRYSAAAFRSVCSIDRDDRIKWLDKSNTAVPGVKARLADALGDKAIAEGNDSEALKQYRLALDAISAMPNSANTLNESACVWYSVFCITGDAQARERCFSNFQQAVDLSPSDAILLRNSAGMLVEAAVVDVVGTQIDLRALREGGGMSLLGYLYRDKAGRDALAQRVKAHPGIVKALSYYEKLMVLSPQSTHAYGSAARIHHWTRNDAAMLTLTPRVEAASFDAADDLTRMKEHLSGAKDSQIKTEMAAGLKRVAETVERARPKGGRTLAVALNNQASAMMAQDMFQGGVDPQKVVALAEEANRICPSQASVDALVSAYLFRSAKDIAAADPAFATFAAKYMRSLGVGYIIVACADQDGPFRQKILANADVQRAMTIMREQQTLFPDQPSIFMWVLLKATDPAQAATQAQAIKGTPCIFAAQLVSTRLQPASATEAMDMAWLLQIQGKPAEAAAVIKKVADLGIPIPAMGN